MGVIFEIDNYIEPKMQLVRIEGKRSEVDKVYNNLKELINNKKILTLLFYLINHILSIILQ